MYSSVYPHQSQLQLVRSVAQLCPTLCDPMNHSTPGLPVHYQLLESTQTHVHIVGDAIQPSDAPNSYSLPQKWLAELLVSTDEWEQSDC